MEKTFTIEMSKEDMLRFYANKIIEDGIKNLLDINIIIPLTDYNTNSIKLENYKEEILQLLLKDERVSDVEIDENLNVDIVFYSDYCPFYYENRINIKYDEILDNPTYQGVTLVNFVNYVKDNIEKNAYTNIRNLINNFTQTMQIKDNNKEVVSNFLKKSIIQTGFVEKYLDHINVYVTKENYKELEKGLSAIVKIKDKEAKRNFMETEEFE